GLGRALLARLSAADAFGSLGLTRRAALWQVLAVGEDLPLFAETTACSKPPPVLPEMPLEQQVAADYDSTGLSLKAHPISFIRAQLNSLTVCSAKELAGQPAQATVRVAGLVLVRQRPGTAKGTIFITLEDETGTMNLLVWPSVWQRFRRAVHQAVALLAEGRVERS